MSRLTKEQAMNLYGRNLPTPTIEKMTLLDVKADDEFIVALDELAAIDFEDDAYEAVLDQMNTRRSQIISTTTRIDMDISFYLQTWEGFDVNELTRELFEQITTSPNDLGTLDTSNSLYINAAVTYPSSPEAGDSVGTLRRKNKLDLLPMFYDFSDRGLHNQLDAIEPHSVRPDANYLAAALSNMTALGANGRGGEYEVSVPLSDFYEVADLSAEYDADDNPIIKVSNIKLTFYITHFSLHPNIVFYAAVSTGSPVALGQRSPLDPVSYSMNFSDLTYEDLVKNGTLSSIGEPVFVDSGGIYYPNMPLRAINKKYYKIDEYGPKQIIAQTNALLSEYRAYLASDSELLDSVNQIKLLIQTEQDSIQFLQILNKAGQVYSETNTTTRLSRFYERFRILVNNADATLRNQQEVVKRVYRNYKVVDARAYVPPPMDAMSYVPELAESSDYLYEQIFHSNVANFVPMDDAPSEYPGRAELPSTPSERLTQFSEEAEVMRNDVVRLLMPYRGGTNVRGFDYDAGDPVSDDVYDNVRQQIAATRLPWESKSGMAETNNKLYTSSDHSYSIDDVGYSASEINEMLGDEYSQDHPLDRAAMKLTWWIYHVWAGRLIQGSEHKGYRANDDFDGVHWYVSTSDRNSFDWYADDIRSKHAEWSIRNPTAKEGKKSYPPSRFRGLVRSLSQEESYVPTPETAPRPDGTEGTGPQQPPVRRPPSAHGSEDWTISKFGYSPSATRLNPLPHFIYVGGTGPNTLVMEQDTDYNRGAHKNPAFWYSVHLTLTDPGQYTGPAGPRAGYYQYYLNNFFWTPADDKDVWAIHTLGNLDEQLSFWVPKSSITPTGREIDRPASLDWDPTGAMTWDAETYWLDNFSNYWERIGGVRAISARRPYLSDGSPYVDGGGNKILDDPNSDDSNIPFVRVKRRKLKRIYRDVRALVMNLFGMDEDGKGMLQATRGETHGSVDSDVDTGSTNAFTTLDAYLQEMPGLIADEVSNKMFDRLRDLPYADLDSAIEIQMEAAAATERLHADYLEALSGYLRKDLCSIYVATSYPGAFGAGRSFDDTVSADNLRRLRGGTEEEASKLMFGVVEGDVISAGEGETVVPYGHFSLPNECAVKGKARLIGAGSTARNQSEIFKLDFGESIKQLMLDNFLDNKEDIKQKAIQYLSSRRELDSLQSDVGIHSTLAEVDIVLNKYGYFFFDLEKYIRKRSLMSQVINVDRLLAYMSRGQEMTNAAVRFESVQIQLNNFGIREEGAPYATPDARWGYHNRGPMPNAALLKLSSDLETSPYSPTNFSRMTFISLEGEEGAPLVYNRIERINAVRFDQIAGFTNNPDAGSSGVVVDSSGNATASPATGYQRSDGTMPPTQPSSPQGGAGTGEIDPYMAGGDYNPYREAERDAALTDRRIDTLEGQEVDINAVLEEYGTANVNTKISLRNYTFEGFADMALNMGATWQNNYRMMCFKYQFFMDDDLAYSNNAHEEYIDTLKSVDDVKISIRIRDNSPDVVKALCDKYIEEHDDFMAYVDAAEENCAFDAFDQKFNKFFADAMLDEYPTPTQQPWFRMVATYVTLYNLFSDVYAGDRSKMEEAANNMLETIRPETGTLSALISFNEACEDFKARLEITKVTVETVDNGMAEPWLLGDDPTDAAVAAESHGSIVDFDIYRTLAVEVIDHIGDYTTREDKMLEEL